MSTSNNAYSILTGAARRDVVRAPQLAKHPLQLPLIFVGAALAALLGWLALSNHNPETAIAPPTVTNNILSLPPSGAGDAATPEYFPAQFQNQSQRTTPEEHIQAF